MSVSMDNNSTTGTTFSSVASTCSSSFGDRLPPNKYLIKTLCFNKKTTTMPNKEEYALLLSCGLGARKWQVSLDLDADTFRYALLNIYPRLSTVPSYTLWTLNKEKNLEKLPLKVNTPCRIRAYLGSQFSGCLIIMPAEEISLGPSPKQNIGTEKSSVQPNDETSTKTTCSYLKRDNSGRFCTTAQENASLTQQQHHHQASKSSILPRQFCLICGRMAKHDGPSPFYNLNTQLMPPEFGSMSVGSMLRSILRIELPKKKLIPSEEVCKKCFRQLNEIEYLENQLKNTKDDLISCFYNTVSKIGRIESHLNPSNGHLVNNYSLQGRLPCASNQSSTSSGNAYPNHLHHAEVGVPQRVFLTPTAYQTTFTEPYRLAVPVGINYTTSSETISSRSQASRSRYESELSRLEEAEKYDRDRIAEEENYYSRGSSKGQISPSSDLRGSPSSHSSSSNSGDGTLSPPILTINESDGHNMSEENLNSASSSQCNLEQSRERSPIPPSNIKILDQVLGLGNVTGTPRQPWKKRYREIRANEEEGEGGPGMKSSRLEETRGSKINVRNCSNIDSGHGGSDEDSTSSTNFDQNEDDEHQHHREEEKPLRLVKEQHLKEVPLQVKNE